MPFEKGKVSNPKGRPKGAKSKTTAEIRRVIQQVMSANLPQLQADLDSMSPGMRWMIIEKMTKYFMPSLTKNDNQNQQSGEVKITVEYTNNNNESSKTNEK